MIQISLSLLTIWVLIAGGIAHAEEADQITFCRLLPTYKQALGVEFQPGIDQKGRAVAPADIDADMAGAAPIRSFESIEIPVELDLAQRFGLNLPSGVELKPYVALISIHKDGRVDYNGQDISRKAHTLCNQGHAHEQAGPPKPEKATNSH